MRSLVTTMACAAALMSLSCAQGPSSARLAEEPAETWTLAAHPGTRIGAVEGDEHLLLHRAGSSLVLPDGRVAVVNSGSYQLRIYDASGRFVTAAGRQGMGPGEWRRPVAVILVHPDTLLVYDGMLRRELLFDTTGAFLRSDDVRALPWRAGTWMLDRTLVIGPTPPDMREQIARVIDRLPVPPNPAGFRYARVDVLGRIWERLESELPDGATEWWVRRRDGMPLARITTPAGFEIQYIGERTIAGRVRDSLNVEYIHTYRIEGARMDETGAFPEAGADITQRAPASEPERTRMKSALRTAQALQEIFFSQPANAYRYAPRADLLAWPDEGMENLVPWVVHADDRGYTMLMFHETERLTCVLTVGDGLLGWQPGVVTCTG
jgi:hypothetical protein